MRTHSTFKLGLELVAAACVGLLVGASPARGGDPTDGTKAATSSRAADARPATTKWGDFFSHRTTSDLSTGIIVGRVVYASPDGSPPVPAGRPKRKGIWSLMPDLFTLKPEATVTLYAPTADGQPALAATTTIDHNGRFAFRAVAPGNGYEVVASTGLGVKTFSGKRTGIAVVAALTTDLGNVEISPSGTPDPN